VRTSNQLKRGIQNENDTSSGDFHAGWKRKGKKMGTIMKFVIYCSCGDEQFVVPDEGALYEIGSYPICYCGNYLKFKAVPNG
jgi:hypothetical protein